MFRYDKFSEHFLKIKQLFLLNPLDQERGAIFIFTAMLLPVLFGFMGIGYDVGNLYMHKARLQNVADAAALAGARAYINSQNNTEESERDALDPSTTGKKEETYDVGGDSKNRTSTHPHADTEADNYIYKNITNLGNSVKTDPYSHFALLSNEDNPRTFYRVGLYEYVPLHFLTFIRGISAKQKVAAEAIVLLTDDTGTNTDTTTVPTTIFGSLYTYSGYLNVKQGTMSNPDANALSKKPSEGGATIQMSFDGKMIYTGDSNNTSEYFGMQDAVSHLYTSEGKEEQIKQDLSAAEMGTNYTNDPKKSATSIALSDYQDILNSKLSKDHIELNMSNQDDKNKFTVDNINNLGSTLYDQQQKDQDGNGLYSLTVNAQYSSLNYTYAIDPTYQNDHNNQYRYYSYDSNNNKMYFIPDNFGNRVPAYIGSNSFTDDKGTWYSGNYVLDGNGNKIYYTISNDNVYFANENHKQITSVSSNSRHSTYFNYTDDNNNKVVINFIEIDNNKLLNNNNKLISHINTNIFHLTGYSDGNITIDKEVTGGGTASEPIYIINDTNQKMKITVTADNVRPIVIIHNGTADIEVEVSNNATFTGVIYAPNVTGGGEGGAMIKLNNSSFKGNIVAKNISISNNGPSSFEQVNYLESDAELYNDIIDYAKEHGQLFSDSQSDNSNPPSNTYTNAWQQWYHLVGSDTATSWFNNLTQSQKVAFWRSWDSVKRPANQELWDWWYNDIWKRSEYGWPFQDWSPTQQDIQDAKDNKAIESFSETSLRLINPRTEINPFTTISS